MKHLFLLIIVLSVFSSCTVNKYYNTYTDDAYFPTTEKVTYQRTLPASRPIVVVDTVCQTDEPEETLVYTIDYDFNTRSQRFYRYSYFDYYSDYYYNPYWYSYNYYYYGWYSYPYYSHWYYNDWYSYRYGHNYHSWYNRHYHHNDNRHGNNRGHQYGHRPSNNRSNSSSTGTPTNDNTNNNHNTSRSTVGTTVNSGVVKNKPVTTPIIVPNKTPIYQKPVNEKQKNPNDMQIAPNVRNTQKPTNQYYKDNSVNYKPNTPTRNTPTYNKTRTTPNTPTRPAQSQRTGTNTRKR